jgi:putative DNA primase/helicase
LAHAGIQGFLGNLEDLYGNLDEDGPQWEHFLQVWYQANGTNEVTTAELVNQINIYKGGIRDALPDELAPYQNDTGRLRVRLGQALGRRRDAQYGDYRLERTGQNGHSKAKRWRVVRPQQDDGGGGARLITITSRPDEWQIATSARQHVGSKAA